MLKFLFSKPKLSKNNFEFKLIHSYENRKKEALRIISNNPDKVPIILEKADNVKIGNLDINKYLINKEITIGQFLHVIRKKLGLSLNESLFLFVNNKYIPKTEETLENIYNKYLDQDNFLYISYTPNNKLGYF
ncbi:Autophagy protein Atg8 ubiquitin [uncultured virus]|nr:Autophagy protein Atg8 ubiquitin [uncultured virus]